VNRGPSWLLLRSDDVPAELDWLGPWERGHLATLHRTKRRNDWLLGRWTAKQTVLGAAEFARDIPDLASMEIRATQGGAPQVFLAGEPLPLAISLSHRAGAGLGVVSASGFLGCDVEWVEDRSAAFVEDYFTGVERELILEQGPAGRALLTNAFWSAKESVLKAMGVGLRVDTRSLSVRMSEEPRAGTWKPFSVRHSRDEVEFQGWWRRHDNWILTVVAELGRHCPPTAVSKEPRGG
jgi:4'-phosphopantetheinyl transferase